MEFKWTKEQEVVYEEVLEMSRCDLERLIEKRGRTAHFSKEEWRLAGRHGLLGLCVPTQYDGRGLDALTTARVVEAFGKGCSDMGLVFAASAHLFACALPILKYGNDTLRGTVLPRLCSGEWVGANAITEAEAGSDVYALKTHASKDGGAYILSGAKSYVTNGAVADIFIVYASTNPADGHLGLSAFVVEKGTPGLSVGKPFGKMGLVSAPASQLYLAECCVPASNLLGREGQGAAIFQSSMQWERSCLFASYLGMMERQLEQTITHARTRRQFGRPIGSNQAVSHRIADMKLRLEAARLLLYRACWLIDQNEGAVLDISLAKLAVSSGAIQSALDAIQIHGGNGYATQTGIERQLRDAIPTAIFSGTTEMHRDIIATELGI